MQNINVEKQFTDIYNATYKKIFAFVYSRISEVSKLDDLLQVIYCSLYKRMLSKGVPSESDCLKILYTAAKHELGRAYKEIKANNYSYSFDDESSAESIEYELSKFEIDDDITEDIWIYITEKGEITKRMFVLHFVHGYTLAQTADLMNVTESMVTGRIYRTIKEMKLHFAKGDNHNEQ